MRDGVSVTRRFIGTIHDETAAIANPRREKEVAGCAISGIMSTSGRLMNGEIIIRSIANMKCRSNGLGGGFAGYGIYPEHADRYCFHIMFMNPDRRTDLETFLARYFSVMESERVPTRKVKGIENAPLLWRYFLDIDPSYLEDTNEHDYVVDVVMAINTAFEGAYVFSSGKNMGVFKGVGFPEDIGEYFRLDDYEAHTWISHGRFPTNTPGWWGGAHPFNLLNWSVVHNGEISSYGINMRHLEMYGYRCTLMTDTEVVAYTLDLLLRRHNLPLDIAAAVIAPPLWSEIDAMPESERTLYTTLRQVYGPLMLNGPFSFVIADGQRMWGITDRIHLRPLIAARKDDLFFLASEEAAIREVSPNLDEVWMPRAGEPVVAELQPVPSPAKAGETV